MKRSYRAHSKRFDHLPDPTRLPVLIISIALLLFALWDASANEAEPFESGAQYKAFLDSYHLHPDPDNVARFLSTIENKQLYLKEHNLAHFSGFLAEVFAANPDRIQAWVEPYRGEEPREYILAALWFADTDESRAALHRLFLSATAPESKAFQKFLNESPPEIGTQPVQSGADLDFLWARFLASGNPEYLVRIVDQLNLMIPDEDGHVRPEGYAAEWSLTGMGTRYERVRETLREEAGRREGKIREILDGILAEIDSTLEEREQ